VFCDTKGGWLRKSNVTRYSFEKIIERAGLPRIRFQDLRHTCATLLLLAEENVEVVSERLGSLICPTDARHLQSCVAHHAEAGRRKMDRFFAQPGLSTDAI